MTCFIHLEDHRSLTKRQLFFKLDICNFQIYVSTDVSMAQTQIRGGGGGGGNDCLKKKIVVNSGFKSGISNY